MTDPAVEQLKADAAAFASAVKRAAKGLKTVSESISERTKKNGADSVLYSEGRTDRRPPREGTKMSTATKARKPRKRTGSPLDKVWDALTEVADEGAPAMGRVNYVHGMDNDPETGTGWMMVVVGGVPYRIDINVAS